MQSARGSQGARPRDPQGHQVAGLAGHLWPVTAPNGLIGSSVQGTWPWWDEGGPFHSEEGHSPEASVPLLASCSALA